jgi:hypothetical protein
MTSLSGAPGQGKSTLTYAMIAQATSGGTMPQSETPQPKAGAALPQGEDGADTVVKPALAAAGAGLDRVSLYDPPEFADNPLVLPGDLKLVEDAVGEVGASLVVIDHAQSFFSCNPHSEQAVRTALRPLIELAERKCFAVLLVHHLIKTTAANAMYQAGGSIAWTAASRAAFRVKIEPRQRSTSACAGAHQEQLGRRPGPAGGTTSENGSTVPDRWDV